MDDGFCRVVTINLHANVKFVIANDLRHTAVMEKIFGKFLGFFFYYYIKLSVRPFRVGIYSVDNWRKNIIYATPLLRQYSA